MGARFVKLNVDEDPDNITQLFGVVSIPTVMIFSAGRVVEKAVGFVNKPRLTELITRYL